MIRTINAINIDLGLGESVTAKLYSEVTGISFDLKNELFHASGKHFYYEGDDENNEKVTVKVIDKVYSKQKVNDIYDLLTLTASQKWDLVVEEVNEGLMFQVVEEFPSLNLNTTDFEIV